MEKVQSVLLFAQALNLDALPKTPATDATLKNAMTVIFTITGAIAVMMVVIAGIKYASSQGDPQAISKAKATIIYALVGLAISIFSVAIVDYVFGRVA